MFPNSMLAVKSEIFKTVNCCRENDKTFDCQNVYKVDFFCGDDLGQQKCLILEVLKVGLLEENGWIKKQSIILLFFRGDLLLKNQQNFKWKSIPQQNNKNKI
jgi:hypothetical protein